MFALQPPEYSHTKSLCYRYSCCRCLDRDTTSLRHRDKVQHREVTQGKGEHKALDLHFICLTEVSGAQNGSREKAGRDEWPSGAE